MFYRVDHDTCKSDGMNGMIIQFRTFFINVATKHGKVHCALPFAAFKL